MDKDFFAPDDVFDAVALGALNIDRVLRVKRIEHERGGERVAFDSVLTPGGSAANTIYGLAILGARTACVGAVGNDSGGEIILKGLKAGHVDVAHVLVKRGASTGEAFCLADQHSERDITIWPGANSQLKSAELVKLGAGIRSRLMHFSSFVDDVQLHAQIEVARSLDPMTMLSFSPGAFYARRGLIEIDELARRCNILFVNSTEMSVLMGNAAMDYATAARLFLDKYDACDTIVVTLGSGDRRSRRKGRSDHETRPPLDDLMVQTQSADERQSCAVFRRDLALTVRYADFARAADPTGAGDAFAAGFLFGVLEGESIETSSLYGHAVAQYSVAGIGARSHLPTRKELLAAVASSGARAISL